MTCCCMDPAVHSMTCCCLELVNGCSLTAFDGMLLSGVCCSESAAKLALLHLLSLVDVCVPFKCKTFSSNTNMHKSHRQGSA